MSTKASLTRLMSLLLLGLALAAASASASPAVGDASEHQAANAGAAQLRRHARNRRSDGTDGAETQLAKRGPTYNGRATFYDAGLGACGWYNSGSDFVVAMNAAQYGNMGQRSSWCGKQIVITYPVLGISQVATVADACPGCPYGGLDMSRGLFGALTNGGFDLGVFQMTWHALGDGDEQPSPKPKPQPTSTKPAYTPPPPSRKPRTSSAPASTPQPTTSHTPSRPQVQQQQQQQSSSSSSSSTSTTPSPAPSPPPAQAPTDNLQNLADLYDALSGMAVAAAS